MNTGYKIIADFRYKDREFMIGHCEEAEFPYVIWCFGNDEGEYSKKLFKTIEEANSELSSQIANTLKRSRKTNNE